MGERVRDAGAVAYDIESLILRFEILVCIDFHIVEFDFHAIEQGIIVCCSGGNLIEGINHLHYAVKYTLRKHETEVTGSCREGRRDE